MKDQPKHTPGPWLADKATYHNGYVEHFVGRDGDAVAIAGDITDPETRQPSEANARLIAAAPDLLEAARLQERHEWAKRNLESIGADPLNPERLALVMEVERTGSAANMARKSAIAKAEGRGVAQESADQPDDDPFYSLVQTETHPFRCHYCNSWYSTIEDKNDCCSDD